MKVRRLVREGEGRYREEDPPERLPDGEVTILDIYGSIFYAAADVIADKLPDVREAKERSSCCGCEVAARSGAARSASSGATRPTCSRGGGALLLAGVGRDMADQLKRTGIEDLLGQHAHLPGPQPGLPVHRGGLRRGPSSFAAPHLDT